MTAPRLPSSGSRREIGAVNWLFCKIAARVSGVPQMHVFTTLGQHRWLFKSWLLFAGALLSVGKLAKDETELVILRVAHLRGCEYELQHHRRVGKRRGVDAATQARIFEGPQAPGLTDRQRALLAATDELISTRNLSDDTWSDLSRHLDNRQLIEFLTLAGQYDALAATLITLRVPLDYPS
jgi:AhpD family alkylhydroperoxidase